MRLSVRRCCATLPTAPAACRAKYCPAKAATTDLPVLTGAVNDFAHIIDPQSAAGIERLSRSLKAASGDVVVVATVPTIEPYGDIQQYATKLFENGGRGIGDKGKDNGILILLALKERKVRIEVGYGNEQWITDRFAGETSRQVMVPEFRNGNYGTGLLAGTAKTDMVAKARGGLDVLAQIEEVYKQQHNAYTDQLADLAVASGDPCPILISSMIISIVPDREVARSRKSSTLGRIKLWAIRCPAEE